MLSDGQCFGAFKRSPQYVQLLAELDLLKDPPEQMTTTGASSLEAQPTSNSDTSAMSISVTEDQIGVTSASTGLQQTNPAKPSTKSSTLGTPSSSSNLGSLLQSIKLSSTENESGGTCLSTFCAFKWLVFWFRIVDHFGGLYRLRRQ